MPKFAPPPVGVFMGGEDGKSKGEGRLEER